MKRLMVLLLVLCLLPLCALAELDEDGDVVVTLPGMEFFFTPIEGAHLLTRESSASAFNRLGFSQRELVPQMEHAGLYALMYFGEDDLVEAQVAAYASVETDFDEMNGFGETLMLETMTTAYTDQGYRVSAADVYYAPEGHTFIRLDMSFDGEAGEERLLIYITCQAGYTVELRFFPYGESLTEDQYLMAELLADSLWIKAME